MKQMTLMPLDIPSAREQIVLCHAFVRSSQYYHQELTVLNPAPTQYDPAYIFPRDMYLYYFHHDQDADLLSHNELVAIVMTHKAPIHCVGSHRPDTDRTLQLIWVPEERGQKSQLIVQFISDIPSAEKMDIIEGLQKMARHIGTDSHVI